MAQYDNDPSKYGEPITYDRSFKGPLENRSCTDVVCLLIFGIFLGAWGFVSYYAITNGDLNKLLVPTDSLNRKCGLDNQVIDKPYLFFFNLEKCIDPLVPISGCPTPQVCVKECPKELFVFGKTKWNTIEELKEKLICQSEVEKSQIRTEQDAKALIDANRCARWYAKSTPYSKRCIPDYLNEKEVQTFEYEVEIHPKSLTDAINNLREISNINGFAQELVEDIITSWPTILVVLIIAMFISLLFIAIMRWVAGPLLWFSIVGVFVALGYGIYFSVSQYIYYRDHPNVPHHSPNLGSTVKNVLEDYNMWLYLAIALSIIFLIILLVVICLRNRIVIAIALVKEGSKAVSSIISTVFFPILPWFLEVVIISYAIAIGLYLASVGDSAFKVVGQLSSDKCLCEGEAKNYVPGSSCVPETFNKNCFAPGTTNNFFSSGRNPCTEAACQFDRITNPSIVGYFHAYNVIGFLWLAFFISAFGDMVLAATFATWYWTFHKSDVPYFTLTRAFFRTIRYHLGTLVLGSLIITICRLIRLILEYIDAKLKKFDNPVTRGILCCMKCFFWCLENFLRFINKNAYIMCAIHGKNFCSSAKDAFNLLMRNCLRVVTLDKVTDFLFFMSKVLITAGVGVGTYYFVVQFPQEYQLHHNWVPTLIVVIGTYLITTVFFSVYSMAVDTLFLCFLEDSERNDGSAEKPYYMSKRLMKILGKKNIIPRHQYR